MLRILGQLASSVALVFAAEALLGTTYLAGFLSGFGVSLSTIRVDPGTAVLTALVPSIYLAPAGLVAFGYVFSVAVGLAAPDDLGSRVQLARKGIVRRVARSDSGAAGKQDQSRVSIVYDRIEKRSDLIWFVLDDGAEYHEVPCTGHTVFDQITATVIVTRTGVADGNDGHMHGSIFSCDLAMLLR